jgi:oxazoline/thiazoline dehydrogenase
MLKNAQSAMGISETPAAIMVFSSRFERVFWKYESLGYRLILIELGSIFQTLHLVAAELDLSVCAIGRGDSSEFSASLGLNYFQETSIGEFVINGKL